MEKIGKVLHVITVCQPVLIWVSCTVLKTNLKHIFSLLLVQVLF